MDLPEEILAIARRELNETDINRKICLAALKEWLTQQPHLTPKLDETFLLTILRKSKYSLERSKKKLDALYTYRTHLPEVFSNRDPFSKEIQAMLDMRLGIPIKPKTPGERWLFVRRVHPDEPSKLSVNSFLTVLSMILDIAMKDYPELAITGFDVVGSGEGYTLSHAMMWSPPLLKKCIKLVLDCNPFRIGSIYVLDAPKVLTTLIDFGKTLTSEKIAKRIHVFSKDSTDPYLDKLRTRLPEELGGTNGTIAEHTEHWRAVLENHKDWLQEEEKYICNESMRPEKAKSYSDVFGMEGSFRTLSVD